jgi:hypothetical protein
MRLLLVIVRYGLGASLLLAGLIAIVVGGGSDTSIVGALLLAGAGIAVIFLNALYRLGASGDAERHQGGTSAPLLRGARS